MSDERNVPAHGGDAQGELFRKILRDSDRYAEALRQRDRDDQRRGAILFVLLLILLALLVGSWLLLSFNY